MKKLRLFAFLLMTSTAVSTVSPRVVAQAEKDCPLVLNEGAKVVINNDNASIRTSPKADGTKNRAYVAKKDSSLELLSTKPIFQGKNCWYQAKPPEDRKEPELWIADENFSPFSKADAPTKKTPDDSSSGEKTLDSKSQGKEDGQKATSLDWSSIGLGIILFLGFSTTGVFLYKLLKRLKNLEQKINSELNSKITGIQAESRQNSAKIIAIQFSADSFERKLREQNQSLLSIQDAVETLPATIIVQFIELLKPELSKFHDKNENIEEGIQIILQKIEEKQGSDEHIPESNDKAIDLVGDLGEKDKPSSTPNYQPLSDEVRELVAKFNTGNSNDFNDSRFHPVKLTEESIQGNLRIDGRRILQFEQAEPAQGTYLEFSADDENWLLPNITSAYSRKIRNQLSENPEIFTNYSGSGNSKLVRPAKLKSVSGGFWEIAEPGEFQ